MIDYVREQTNLRFLYGVIHADVALVGWVFSIQGCLYEVYDLVRHTINNKTDLFIKRLTSLIPHKSQKLTKNGFDRVDSEASKLAKYNMNLTISSRETQVVGRLLLLGELAVSVGTKVTKYA